LPAVRWLSQSGRIAALAVLREGDTGLPQSSSR
jgi:hypothetical protein